MATSKSAPDQSTKLIRVNLARQTVEAYEGDKRIFAFDCVAGDKDHPTDRGAFRIFDKRNPYRSKKYDVQMNYAMFFTQDGKALHQYYGPVPLSVVRAARGGISEWFGSHGCVRLEVASARALFDWAPRGTTVLIS